MLKKCKFCDVSFQPDKFHPYQVFHQSKCRYTFWNMKRRQREQPKMWKCDKCEMENPFNYNIEDNLQRWENERCRQCKKKRIDDPED